MTASEKLFQTKPELNEEEQVVCEAFSGAEIYQSSFILNKGSYTAIKESMADNAENSQEFQAGWVVTDIVEDELHYYRAKRTGDLVKPELDHLGTDWEDITPAGEAPPPLIRVYDTAAEFRDSTDARTQGEVIFVKGQGFFTWDENSSLAWSNQTDGDPANNANAAPLGTIVKPTTTAQNADGRYIRNFDGDGIDIEWYSPRTGVPLNDADAINTAIFDAYQLGLGVTTSKPNEVIEVGKPIKVNQNVKYVRGLNLAAGGSAGSLLPDGLLIIGREEVAATPLSKVEISGNTISMRVNHTPAILVLDARDTKICGNTCQGITYNVDTAIESEDTTSIIKVGAKAVATLVCDNVVAYDSALNQASFQHIGIFVESSQHNIPADGGWVDGNTAFPNAYNVRILRNNVTNAAYGIKVKSSEDVVIADNHIQFAQKQAVMVSKYARNVDIVDNVIELYKISAILVEQNAKHTRITNNRIWRDRVNSSLLWNPAIWLRNEVSHSEVSGNYIEGDTTVAIALLNSISNVAVKDNNIVSTAHVGVLVASMDSTQSSALLPDHLNAGVTATKNSHDVLVRNNSIGFKELTNSACGVYVLQQGDFFITDVLVDGNAVSHAEPIELEADVLVVETNDVTRTPGIRLTNNTYSQQFGNFARAFVGEGSSTVTDLEQTLSWFSGNGVLDTTIRQDIAEASAIIDIPENSYTSLPVIIDRTQVTGVDLVGLRGGRVGQRAYVKLGNGGTVNAGTIRLNGGNVVGANDFSVLVLEKAIELSGDLAAGEWVEVTRSL